MDAGRTPPRSQRPRGALGVLRRLTLVVLVAFVAGLVSVTASQAFGSLSGSDPASHCDGSPCPDAPDSDHPCGPACPCVCCHVKVAVPWQTLPFQAALGREFVDLPPLGADDLHPEDVSARVFHPPRS